MTQEILYSRATAETRDAIIRIMAESMAQSIHEAEPANDDDNVELRSILSKAGHTDTQIDAAADLAIRIYRGEVECLREH